MPGPHPKPAELRQRTNRKAGADVLPGRPDAVVPELREHPQGVRWHPYTLEAWRRAWESPMSAKWVPSDADGLFRLAMSWNKFYLEGKEITLAEVRLQEQRFGLSPLDRSRLQWEVNRGEDAEQASRKRNAPPADTKVRDPRQVLKAV